MSLRLLVLLLPLALDTFAISVLLGAAGLDAARQRRASMIFVAFEAGAPLVGLVLGLGAARAIGSAADWVAIVSIAAVGGWLLIEDEERERERARMAVRRGLGAALALGVAVSLDELAIGFTFGLLGVPVAWAIGLIGVQALAASWLGFRVGARAGRWAEPSERVAGLLLLTAAGGLIVLKLSG